MCVCLTQYRHPSFLMLGFDKYAMLLSVLGAGSNQTTSQTKKTNRHTLKKKNLQSDTVLTLVSKATKQRIK